MKYLTCLFVTHLEKTKLSNHLGQSDVIEPDCVQFIDHSRHTFCHMGLLDINMKACKIMIVPLFGSVQ